MKRSLFLCCLIFVSIFCFSSVSNAELDVLTAVPQNLSFLETQSTLTKTSTTTHPIVHILDEPIYVLKGKHEGFLIRYKNQSYNNGAIPKGTNKYFKVGANATLGGPELYRLKLVPGRDEFYPVHDLMEPMSLDSTVTMNFDGSTGHSLYYVKIRIPQETENTTFTVNINVRSKVNNAVLERIEIPIQLVSATGVHAIPEKTTSLLITAKLRPFKRIDAVVNNGVIVEGETDFDEDAIPGEGDLDDLNAQTNDIDSPTKIDQEINRTKELIDILADWRVNNICNFTFYVGAQDKSNDPNIVTKVGDLIDYIMGNMDSVTFPSYKQCGKKKLEDIHYGSLGYERINNNHEYIQDPVLRQEAIDLAQTRLASTIQGEIDHLNNFNSAFAQYVNIGKIYFRMSDEPNSEIHMNLLNTIYTQITAASYGSTNYSDLKIMLTRGIFWPTQITPVDFWFVRTIPKDKQTALNEISLIQNTWGDKIGIYMNSAHKPGLANKRMRLIGWVLHCYGLDGYLLYGVNKYGAERDLITGQVTYFDPMTSRMFQNAPRGNDGMGIFVYWNQNTDTIYKSIRGEEFREGIEDYEIIKKIRTSPGSGSKLTAARAVLDNIENETFNIMSTSYKDDSPVPNYFIEMQNVLRCLK